MSREGYVEIYAQEPPAEAHFGVDISFWQATANGETIDHGAASGVWDDIAAWAEWVNMRASYGFNSADGAIDLHVQCAAEHGYTGKLGGYHFYYAGNPAASAANYLSKIQQVQDLLDHHMCDAEAAPVASAAELVEFCDRVEQARQQICFLYAGWSYLNRSGNVGAKKLWVPHYATARYHAWHPVPGSQDTYDAPFMPDQRGFDYPTIWQFGSLTARHGHLDLNMGVKELADALGLAGGTPTTGDDFLVGLNQQQQNEIWQWSHDLMNVHLPSIHAKLDALALQLAHVVQKVETTVWHLGNFDATAGREAETVAAHIKRMDPALLDAVGALASGLADVKHAVQVLSAGPTGTIDLQPVLTALTALDASVHALGSGLPTAVVDELTSTLVHGTST